MNVTEKVKKEKNKKAYGFNNLMENVVLTVRKKYYKKRKIFFFYTNQVSVTSTRKRHVSVDKSTKKRL